LTVALPLGSLRRAARRKRHLSGGSAPCTPWPVEAAGSAESVENRRGPLGQFTPSARRFPTLPAAPWKSLRDFHSSHRPDPCQLPGLRKAWKTCAERCEIDHPLCSPVSHPSRRPLEIAGAISTAATGGDEFRYFSLKEKKRREGEVVLEKRELVSRPIGGQASRRGSKVGPLCGPLCKMWPPMCWGQSQASRRGPRRVPSRVWLAPFLAPFVK
jgi:hypothetical protein